MIVTSLCVYRCAIGSGDDPGPAGYTAQLARHVAPLTLGIYAVHPFWIALLGRAGLSASFVHPLLGIPLTTAVVLVLSLLTAAGLARVPFLKAVVV